ncbi:hypothetical protein HGRIS_005853 [Hohenbuehelia grisea]|uniref:HpcH/HpaI aldolase/citrate lyase domain-containing protein n=1 Tax=Hohenbuehelia grisea TaxID=104357 RepID=A0ABR3JYC6_9AGAR
MATHPLLSALKANKPAFGAWLTIPGSLHARTVAKANPHISWITVDCEHGLIPLTPGAAESVSAIQSAVQGSGPSAIVRIPATGASDSTSWQIKYALDAGARGVLVPMVSTAAKAKEIVADSRFPPVGRRGFGSPFAHDTWGVSAAEYLKGANETVLVLVQIETEEGFKNAKEIAAVDGLDVLFIGPFDLSLALGYAPPSPEAHPEVDKVIKEILKVSHEAGKKCAIYCTSGAQAARRAAEGFDMVVVTSDVAAVTEAINNQIEAAMQG